MPLLFCSVVLTVIVGSHAQCTYPALLQNTLLTQTNTSYTTYYISNSTQVTPIFTLDFICYNIEGDWIQERSYFFGGSAAVDYNTCRKYTAFGTAIIYRLGNIASTLFPHGVPYTFQTNACDTNDTWRHSVYVTRDAGVPIQFIDCPKELQGDWTYEFNESFGPRNTTSWQCGTNLDTMSTCGDPQKLAFNFANCTAANAAIGTYSRNMRCLYYENFTEWGLDYVRINLHNPDDLDYISCLSYTLGNDMMLNASLAAGACAPTVTPNDVPNPGVYFNFYKTSNCTVSSTMSYTMSMTTSSTMSSTASSTMLPSATMNANGSMTSSMTTSTTTSATTSATTTAAVASSIASENSLLVEWRGLLLYLIIQFVWTMRNG